MFLILIFSITRINHGLLIKLSKINWTQKSGTDRGSKKKKKVDAHGKRNFKNICFFYQIKLLIAYDFLFFKNFFILLFLKYI